MQLSFNSRVSHFFGRHLPPFVRAMLAGKQKRELRRGRSTTQAELFEKRELLTTIVVTSLEDSTTADSFVTLREAIQAANTDTAVDGSAAGSGADQITFLTGLTGTIAMNGTQFEITEELTITGNGALSTIIDGQLNSRLFNVADSVSTTFENLTLTRGQTSEGGAAINAEPNSSSMTASITLRSSAITGNLAAGDGGAIRLVVGGDFVPGNGAVTIENSTLSGNTAGGSGGAVFVYGGDVTILQSTVSGNTATGDGGGIRSVSVVTYSPPPEAYGASAVFDRRAVTITQSTVTGNTAARGGGISGSNSNGFIRNSIIAGNTGGSAPDLVGLDHNNFVIVGMDPFTVFNSLIGDNSGNALAEAQIANSKGNFIGSATTPINPLLGPLQNNGGQTSTHAILAGSMALNSGTNADAPFPMDQRGGFFGRSISTDILSLTVDMGAFEQQLVVDKNLDQVNDGNFGAGELTLREAIDLSNGIPGVKAISFAASTNSTEFDLTLGQMEISTPVAIVGNGVSSTVIDAQQDSRVFAISNGDVNIEKLTLKNGRTTDEGETGGVIRSASSGSLSIIESLLTGNSTTGYGSHGGAVFTNSGALTISRSTLSGNLTSAAVAGGGAIYSASGNVTVLNSTLSGNSTSNNYSHGGAIFANTGNVRVTQSTLSGNSTAGSFGYGGAITVKAGGLFISQSTVTNNHATNSKGGGVFAWESSVYVEVRNSIIAGNTAGSAFPDIYIEPAASRIVHYVLFGDGAGTHLAQTTGTTPDGFGNLVGGAENLMDPELGPLRNNGGPTFTHALLSDSPAINRGFSQFAGPEHDGNVTDQRGFPFARTVGNAVDMGAFEIPLLNGTNGADSFVLTYSTTTTAGTVTVMVSTAGRPVVNLGTFPMNSPLTIDGLGGTDSVRIVGTSSADTFTVASSGLTVNGASLLLTSIENRTVAGGAGSDVYKFDADATLGLFTLDESGGGTDTLDLSLTTTLSVTMNISTSATQTVNSKLSLKLGSGLQFERIIGGSKNDTLTGNSLANILTGNGGDDVLSGGFGSDTLNGGAGNDRYVFGQATSGGEVDTIVETPSLDSDTLDFTSRTIAVTVSIANGAQQQVHIDRALILGSGLAIENVIGGSGIDTMTGNSRANTLTGNAGNDILNGGLGSDTLNGGAGNDRYVFGGATSGGEVDTIVETPSLDSDTLDFSSRTIAVTVSIATGAQQQVHTDRAMILASGLAIENVIGGSSNDSLTGNSRSNALTGNAGHDVLNGGLGSDFLIGGHGSDRYVFGGATVGGELDTITELSNLDQDTLDFSSRTTPVTMNISDSVNQQRVHTDRKIKLSSGLGIDIVLGGSGDDTLTGNSSNNVLVGNGGKDKLAGNSGRDILIGGLGLDTLSGGNNDDILVSGRTTHDATTSSLGKLLTGWISGSSYATRVAALKAGVGSPAVTLKAKTTALNDSGEKDSLTGGSGADGYFKALDEAIVDLFAGEIVEAL